MSRDAKGQFASPDPFRKILEQHVQRTTIEGALGLVPTEAPDAAEAAAEDVTPPGESFGGGAPIAMPTGGGSQELGEAVRRKVFGG